MSKKSENKAIDELSKRESDEIRKQIKISFDGKQLMLRIPKEFSDFYKLKKGETVELLIKLLPNDKRKNRQIPLSVTIIESDTNGA